MLKEKRKPRAYKIADAPYLKAMKRASKENGHLAVHIEHWVKSYADGLEMKINYKSKPQK